MKSRFRIILSLLLLLIICFSAGCGENAASPSDSSFEIHFIDVGEGDAALVLCDEKAMLIDGGHKSDSSLMFTYLKDRGIEYLDYVVCTHPHEDHVGGLAGALNYAKAGTTYCSVKKYDSKAFNDFIKYLNKNGTELKIPSHGDSFKLGSAKISVLAPLKKLESVNDNCIVLKITYGQTSFLMMADAENDEEQSIIENGADLRSTVLKVGHHGSPNSSSLAFLKEVMPAYAVVSVGDNNFGHPSERVLEDLDSLGAAVYRTDLNGDIICRSDGKSVTFETQKNAAETIDRSTPEETETEAETETDSDLIPAVIIPDGTDDETTEIPDKDTPVDTGIDYVYNKNTKKFHYPSCSSVDEIKESNKGYYHGDRSYLISQGYQPCKRCKP